MTVGSEFISFVELRVASWKTTTEGVTSKHVAEGYLHGHDFYVYNAKKGEFSGTVIKVNETFRSRMILTCLNGYDRISGNRIITWGQHIHADMYQHFDLSQKRFTDRVIQFTRSDPVSCPCLFVEFCVLGVLVALIAGIYQYSESG